jgi:dTDP-glucose 4,6-dehydratase
MTVLVTGGAGFIGGNFILDWFRDPVNKCETIVNIDLLTYAGNIDGLKALDNNPSHIFIKGDICDRLLIDAVLAKYRPRAIINFAAESHVDRSIDGPAAFIRTNIEGTFVLLEASRSYIRKYLGAGGAEFRFHHVSTDEVYGSLGPTDNPFVESNPYRPSSPYSASKAASDHLVRAWHHTFGLPAVVTNCSNNYGPLQFPEKLIPLMIVSALAGKPLPVYGDGQQVRDWLYVSDHCSAIRAIMSRGRVGETYNVGGRNELSNLTVVHMICSVLDELKPDPRGSYSRLISFVADRPGHDRRYSVDIRKIERELDWRPRETFETGLRRTVAWYLDNMDWVAHITTKLHR